MTNARILTLNAGSSSLKFALFPADGPLEALTRGQVEGLGATPTFVAKGATGQRLVERAWSEGDGPQDARGALALLIGWLDEAFPGADVVAVGHRVVHGGKLFDRPVLVDDRVIDLLDDLDPLAPLHQPHNLAGVQAARHAFPDAAQIACFDTAFHRSHDWLEDTFALPRNLYDEGVRRYGFHGLSYEYIARTLRDLDPDLAGGRVIVAHLGNGASMCALHDGRSVASTMGFSALDGLCMGTRTGQLDPGVVLYLMAKGMSYDEVSDLVYKRSGLKGLSGISHDMRTLSASDDRRAKEAIAYFCHRVRRETGALAAVLGGLDGFVFTGGIGENAAPIRRACLAGLDFLGLEIDDTANTTRQAVISPPGARVRVRVVPTDEEANIAGHARTLMASLARGLPEPEPQTA